MSHFIQFLRTTAGIILLILCTINCGSPDRSSYGSAQVRDSAGIRIVMSSAPAWEIGEEWKLDTSSVVVFGDGDDPAEQLWQVRGVTRFSDGRVAVLNAGSGEIRYFDSRGRVLQAAGAIGGGPGEFQLPLAFSKGPGDTLIVLDRDGSRVLFDPQGRPFRELPFRRADVDLENPEGFTFDAPLPDGTILGRSRPHQGPRTLGSGWFRPKIQIERRNGASVTLAEFGTFGEIQQELIDVGERNLPIVPPFNRNTAVSSGGTSPRVIVGDNDRFELQVFDLDGNLVQLIRREYQEQPVTPPEVEAWKERQRNSAWAQNRLPLWERGWAEMRIPESKPAFGPVLGISTHGHPWVAEYTDPPIKPRRLHVFHPDGFFLGDLEIPDGLAGTPGTVEIGPDYFLGVFLDEYDVETVRLYRLETEIS